MTDSGAAAVLEVVVPRADVDDASGLLWRSGAVTAIVEEPHADGETVSLRAGMTSISDATGAVELIGGRWPVAVVADDSGEWITEARAQAEVVRVGDRVVLVPPGRQVDAEHGALLITVDAASAFGSGSHATTRMALASLERVLEPGLSVLDVGCGSGVLAVTAARLGAGHVLALDVDDAALAATRANAEANQASAVVEVSSAPVSAIDSVFDVVVANLTATTLIDLAPMLAERAAAGGDLLLTGILERRVGEVTTAYECLGLVVTGCNESGDWSLLELRKAR